MGRVIITGGTGLIGDALTKALASKGHEVILLSRDPGKAQDLPRGARCIAWDGRTANGWGKYADGANAIVNLAGATIARPPWTASYKRLIRRSRVDAGRAIVEAVRDAKQKPAVLIQSSGINYYGVQSDAVRTEQSPAGNDYLSDVCKDWEASTAEVEPMGVRRAIIRTALVMAKEGGVLPLMALPFRFFVGGPLGSGKQYVSWIHLTDEVGAIQFLIENAQASGAFNLVAPKPVTNREFSRALGHALHRPSWFPTPALPMRLALGEMATLLVLGSMRVVPDGLQRAGYHFQFTDVDTTLRDVLR
ncbi:MAG: TIGR01777 family oxidoreductase [Chloroflexi bacterium]|nr:TIGR01777 family oxidoreductase [Chloroflexota bacterium]